MTHGGEGDDLLGGTGPMRGRARSSRRGARHGRRSPSLLIGTVVTALAVALTGLVVGGGAAAALRAHPPSSERAAGPQQLVAAHPAAPETFATDVRACSIDGQSSDAAALDLRGLVVDAASGEVRFERAADSAGPTASVMKLITAVTATHVLGADTRITTTVVPGTAPGSVVLVGAGDPTLRSGGASYYGDGAASIADLAAQVSAATGGVASVGVDESLFGGPQWQASWDDVDRRDGYIAPISPAMVDAGRGDATAMYSERTTAPGPQAGQALAGALGASFDAGVAPQPGAEPIAQVESPTIAELVRVMLVDSDNVIAETLARLVAIKLGVGDDFAAVDAGQRQALESLGLDTTGFVGADGSGLSPDDRATPRLLIDLLELVQTNPALAQLRGDLPQNQLTGTLRDRLGAVPEGAINAKTGWIDDVFALAGWLRLESGQELRFAFFVVRPDPGAPRVNIGNRDALDAIVAAVHGCGDGLSNS